MGAEYGLVAMCISNRSICPMSLLLFEIIESIFEVTSVDEILFLPRY